MAYFSFDFYVIGGFAVDLKARLWESKDCCYFRSIWVLGTRFLQSKPKKRSCHLIWSVYRLSKFHDSVIHLIFSFMSMEYVVRTTILSKRWKDLWTLVPYLNFQSEASDELELGEFRHFVNRTLILWRGTKIQKFTLYL